MLVHASIADIHEGRLLELLVASPHWRSTLFAVKGIPAGSVPVLQVPLAAAPGGHRGDVDILLHAPGAPDSAVAIEVKRIKIRNGQPNKLHEFKKGVQQANRHARLGFSQVYLYIFVVVDSREQNAGKISYDDGLSPLLRNRIRDTVSTTGLDPRVGLIHHEIVQPMDDPPLGVGTFGAHLIRLASEVTQPAELTAWLREVVSKRTSSKTQAIGAAER